MRSNFAMPYRIRVRVLPEEKQTMIDAARHRGQTLSDFIRETAIEAARQVTS